MTNEDFKNAVVEFLNETGMSATAFGTKAKNDPSFYNRIMSGQEVKEKGKERVLKFMEQYKENSDGKETSC